MGVVGTEIGTWESLEPVHLEDDRVDRLVDFLAGQRWTDQPLSVVCGKPARCAQGLRYVASPAAGEPQSAPTPDTRAEDRKLPTSSTGGEDDAR